MTVKEKIGLTGLVPVAVFDELEDAVPAAQALYDGGLGVIEVTLRTKQGIPAIKDIKEQCPGMMVGAGTVLSVAQAQLAAEAGAEFIVSPGFNDDVVRWCLDNKIEVTPGCVTPTEIEHALSFGLNVLKFFPANIYGGINGCKALCGPYRNVSFIPTGGINLSTLPEYADKSYIHAVGGGWMCSSADIVTKNFSGITKTARASIDKLLGFELAHIGINTEGERHMLAVSKKLGEAFGLELDWGEGSTFVGNAFEVMKGEGPGDKGHIAIKTNNLERAVYHLGFRGFSIDESQVGFKNGKRYMVYLDGQTAGFGIHLLQK